MIVGEQHLNHVYREWQRHFNSERPHSARGHLRPVWIESANTLELPRSTWIVCTSRLGGLLNSYSRRAA